MYIGIQIIDAWISLLTGITNFLGTKTLPTQAICSLINERAWGVRSKGYDNIPVVAIDNACVQVTYS